MTREAPGWPPTPAEVRDQYSADLFDDFLPFMAAHVIDEKYGGFPCAVWPDGRRDSFDRSTWFEGRGLWVYSHLYGALAREQEFLEVAERTAELLTASAPTDPTGRPRNLARDGSPAGPPDFEVYSDLFVAEGQAAFAHVTGDDGLWHRAAETTLGSIDRVMRPEYRANLEYVVRPDGSHLGSVGPPGVRPLGVWMLIIRVLTELLSERHDAALSDALRTTIELVLTRHLNPRFSLLNEVLGPGMQQGVGPAEKFVYLGHCIETLWMILDAALLLGEAPLFDTAAALFDRHCQVASDSVHGGLFRALTDVDTVSYTLDKTLWVQAEAINGSILLASTERDPGAWKRFAALSGYVHALFPLRELDSPVWRDSADRLVTSIPDRPRVEHYHHPRMLMRVLETLARIDQSDKCDHE